MRLQQLMVCSTVGICLLSSSAFGAEKSRKSSFRAIPLAAPHHGSYGTPQRQVQQQKPQAQVKKTHFWSR